MESDALLTGAIYVEASALADSVYDLVTPAVNEIADYDPHLATFTGGVHDGLAHAAVQAQVLSHKEQEWHFPCTAYTPNGTTQQDLGARGSPCFMYLFSHLGNYQQGEWRVPDFFKQTSFVGSECFTLVSSKVAPCIQGMTAVLYLYHYYGVTGKGCYETPHDPDVPIVDPAYYCGHLGFGRRPLPGNKPARWNSLPTRPVYVQKDTHATPLAMWCERFVDHIDVDNHNATDAESARADVLLALLACVSAPTRTNPADALCLRFPEAGAAGFRSADNCLGVLSLADRFGIDANGKAQIKDECGAYSCGAYSHKLAVHSESGPEFPRGGLA
jgi:hypothetical protein